jgi:hypothetical protein
LERELCSPRWSAENRTNAAIGSVVERGMWGIGRKSGGGKWGKHKDKTFVM